MNSCCLVVRLQGSIARRTLLRVESPYLRTVEQGFARLKKVGKRQRGPPRHSYTGGTSPTSSVPS